MRDITDRSNEQQEWIIDVQRDETINLSLAVFGVIKACIRIEKYIDKGYDDGDGGKAYWKDVVTMGVNNSRNKFIKSEKTVGLEVKGGEKYKIQGCGEFIIKQI